MILVKGYKFIFLIFFVFISCSLKSDIVESNLKGQWAIEETLFNGKSYQNQMFTNVLIFKENYEVSVPETFHFKKDRNATWEVDEKRSIVTIKTINRVFNFNFDVEFINRTQVNPLGVILKSDTVYIKAFKLLDFH